MRRSTPLKTSGARASDPYLNLTPKQLELIGAIAMIYNDAEETLIDMCRLGLQLPINFREVLGRINGIEGIVEIVKRVCEKWGFTEEERLALGETLGADGFLGLKKHRDGVIHARVYDAATSIGKSKQGRGQIQDVLLAKDALQGLYDRLYWLERGALASLTRTSIQKENSTKQKFQPSGLDTYHIGVAGNLFRHCQNFRRIF